VAGPDALQRFVFERARVRGELVVLTETWREVRRRRDYPEAVRQSLGELTAASVLLAATLKFEGGALVLQIQGGRPVDLLVVDARPTLLRAMARWDGGLPALGPPAQGRSGARVHRSTRRRARRLPGVMPSRSERRRRCSSGTVRRADRDV
jgi:redox-regulated HSP33 family molecular chaperone